MTGRSVRRERSGLKTRPTWPGWPANRRFRKGLRLDPNRARMTFKDFAENVFLPHHVVSPARTRELGYCIRGRLNPVFGDLALADISRERIRAWVATEAARRKPATVRSWKVNLTTILNTAVALDYLAANPALGVKPPREPPLRLKVIDHDEYARIRDSLPGPVSRLIVEVAIETGLRWVQLSSCEHATVACTARSPI